MYSNIYNYTNNQKEDTKKYGDDQKQNTHIQTMLASARLNKYLQIQKQ